MAILVEKQWVPLRPRIMRRKIPFPFVTGYGRESLPEAFAQAPMLGKPFSPEQLIEALLQLLRQPATNVRVQN
jgi:CheY-like chemotaxis protein